MENRTILFKTQFRVFLYLVFVLTSRLFRFYYLINKLLIVLKKNTLGKKKIEIKTLHVLFNKLLCDMHFKYFMKKLLQRSLLYKVNTTERHLRKKSKKKTNKNKYNNLTKGKFEKKLLRAKKIRKKC
jgi:hypothetical protein